MSQRAGHSLQTWEHFCSIKGNHSFATCYLKEQQAARAIKMRIRVIHNQFVKDPEETGKVSSYQRYQLQV
jgi:hypothetical protein